MKNAMFSSLRTFIFLPVLLAALFQLAPLALYVHAQERPTQERIIQDIELRGFSNVTNVTRRGGNYIFQAKDAYGAKVRGVMNAETGEIVGISRIMPKK